MSSGITAPPNPTTEKHISNHTHTNIEFDLKRLRKIQKLRKKIADLNQTTQINTKCKIRKDIQLSQLKKRAAIEISDVNTRYRDMITEVENTGKQRKQALNEYILNKFHRLKQRIYNIKTNPQSFKYINNYYNKEKHIIIRLKNIRKLSKIDIDQETNNIFNNWSSENLIINKRLTRSKRRRINQANNIYNDWNKYRFSLTELQIKQDFKMFEKQNEYDIQSLILRMFSNLSTFQPRLGFLNNVHINDNYDDGLFQYSSSSINQRQRRRRYKHRINTDYDVNDGRQMQTRSRKKNKHYEKSGDGSKGWNGSGLQQNNNISVIYKNESHLFSNSFKEKIMRVCPYSYFIDMNEIGFTLKINTERIYHGKKIFIENVGGSDGCVGIVVKLDQNSLTAVEINEKLVQKRKVKILLKDIKLGRVSVRLVKNNHVK